MENATPLKFGEKKKWQFLGEFLARSHLDDANLEKRESVECGDWLILFMFIIIVVFDSNI